MISPSRLNNAWQSQDLVDSWLVIFSDLITLLVTMFVLFLSMSTLKAGELDQGITTAWSDAGYLTRPPEGLIPGQAGNGVPLPGIGDAGAWIERFKHRLGRYGLSAGYVLHMDERGLVLQGSSDWTRADGGWTADGLNKLEGLATYLVRTGSDVAVTQVGAGVGSSWQTIADRVQAAGRVLMSNGVRPEQITYVARRSPAGGPEIEGAISPQLEFVFAPVIPDTGR